MKVRFIRTILLVFATLFAAGIASAVETATQVAMRSSQLLQRASGVRVEFTLDSQGNRLNGTLVSAGNKFAITTPGMSTWYDGKTMWTYNSRTGETTITNPTAAEVAETNPFSLIAAGTGKFSAFYAKKQPAKGKGRRVVLTAKGKQLGVKSVAVTIADGTYMPTNIVVTPLSGTPTTVNIKRLNTKSNFSASDFVYPTGKYPKAEIIDLR